MEPLEQEKNAGCLLRLNEVKRGLFFSVIYYCSTELSTPEGELVMIMIPFRLQVTEIIRYNLSMHTSVGIHLNNLDFIEQK